MIPVFIVVLVFQRMDAAIHWINQYPLDKYYQDLLSYPVDIQWISFS